MRVDGVVVSVNPGYVFVLDDEFKLKAQVSYPCEGAGAGISAYLADDIVFHWRVQSGSSTALASVCLATQTWRSEPVGNRERVECLGNQIWSVCTNGLDEQLLDTWTRYEDPRNMLARSVRMLNNDKAPITFYEARSQFEQLCLVQPLGLGMPSVGFVLDQTEHTLTFSALASRVSLFSRLFGLN